MMINLTKKNNIMITICHCKSFIQIKRGDECSITACAPYFKVSTLFTDSIIKLRILPYCLILPSHHPPAYTTYILCSFTIEQLILNQNSLMSIEINFADVFFYVEDKDIIKVTFWTALTTSYCYKFT